MYCSAKLSCAFILAFACSFLMASDNKEQEGRDLISRAATTMNIFELPSFEMRGSVRLDNYGKPVDGSYLLLWDGPERWREEITLPGYSEVSVGGPGTVSLKRTTDFIPLQIDELHAALGFGAGASHEEGFANIALRQDEKVKKVRERKIEGVKVRCVETVDSKDRSREICVDPANGSSIRGYPFLDKDMISLAGKLFPSYVTYVENHKTLVEVRITELKAVDQFPQSAFAFPEGATSRPGCMNPAPSRIVKKIQPHYPDQDRQNRVEGTVGLFGVIRKDGSLNGLRVISGVTSGLNEASLAAVRQWRYEPATCNSNSIESETVITVHYHLQAQ